MTRTRHLAAFLEEPDTLDPYVGPRSVEDITDDLFDAGVLPDRLSFGLAPITELCVMGGEEL